MSSLLQRFDWPIARVVEETETIIIELYVRSRLFADKLLGTYGLVLQSVIRDGRLSVSDNLVDPNNKPLPVSTSFLRSIIVVLNYSLEAIQDLTNEYYL